MAIGIGSSWDEDCGCNDNPPRLIDIGNVLEYVRRRTKLAQLDQIEAAVVETRDKLIYGTYARYKNLIPRTLRSDGVYYTVVKTASTTGNELFDRAELWLNDNLSNGGYTKVFYYSSKDWPDESFDIKFDDPEMAKKFEREFKYEVSREIALDLG